MQEETSELKAHAVPGISLTVASESRVGGAAQNPASAPAVAPVRDGLATGESSADSAKLPGYIAGRVDHAPVPLEAPFAGLEPVSVWRHFAMLCRIPRPSKQEGALRDALRAWASEQGLAAEVDAAGNLILRKPAMPGCEGAPGVVLQAHLDMVCQKNAGCPHDFSRDPIVPTVRDGWLLAEDTTLGADNGIGVALILSVLEDRGVRHGPLEALLTVDEEAGMGGARGLEPGRLNGRLMLNLDTEEWGEFYMGCAGGLDVDVDRPARPEATPAGHQGWRLTLGGLRGGHSGIDIHEGRGNAIKLLVRILRDLAADLPLRLGALRGGSARNALPREAVAHLSLPAGEEGRLAARVGDWQALLRTELAGVDDGVTLTLIPDAVPRTVLVADEQRLWLDALHASPHGVARMSVAVPGVVETSNNLGMLDLSAEGGRCNYMVRSLRDAGCIELAERIAALWSLCGTPARISGFYPGWAPDPDSALLKVCQAVYVREFASRGAGGSAGTPGGAVGPDAVDQSGEAAVRVIHAGLECGLIGARYPGLDTVSFGPTIRGAHAPGERVDIASVGRCRHLLTFILEALI